MEYTTLSNGLKVVIVPDTSAPAGTLLMRGQHRLFPDVVGQGPQQRHTLGGGERQIESTSS